MNFRLLLLLALIPLLGACAKYKAKPLRTLNTMPIQGTSKVNFAAEAFGKGKSKTYLERNVIKRGYVPVQIAIKNESNDNLILSMRNINLKTENVEDVVHNVSFDPPSRGLAYGIPAFILLSPAFLIAAIIDPLWAAQANDRMFPDYLKKSLSDSLIRSKTTLEGLIFVAINNFSNKLKVVLINERSGEEIVCEAIL